ARVKADESVMLLFLFNGKIASRHGFLFDDSTDDAQKAPQPLYAEEGNAEERPADLPARLKSFGEVLPVKGFIPVPMGSELFRLLSRGPVMEVELASGAAFRNVLAKDEAERFAGYLLKLKLEGKIELEVET